jgi:hypothetical protein
LVEDPELRVPLPPEFGDASDNFVRDGVSHECHQGGRPQVDPNVAVLFTDDGPDARLQNVVGRWTV